MSKATPLRDEPTWLSPDQVCEVAPGMTPRRLEYLRGKRQGPRYFKPTERTVLYAKADIDEWIEASAVATRTK